jgi:hypothetical protein
MKLKQYVHTTKRYIAERSELFVGVAIIAVLGAIVAVIVIAVQLSGPKIDYQPFKACDLLTPAEAHSLLGDKVISTDSNDPTIVGNMASSKCGYTDENSNQDEMMLAAVAVRSGINDTGVAQNKTDFTNAKTTSAGESVTGIGDSAFFNKTNGQLNVLKGHQWYIISYGVGAAPEANTIDKALVLARKVVR